MNTYTRNLIASLILAPLAPLGLYALYRGSWELAASFGVVAGLAVLGVIDLRAASRRHPESQNKDAMGLKRPAKSKA